MLDFPAPRRFYSVNTSEHALLSFESSVRIREPALARAFEDLFIEHYPRLVRILIRLVGSAGQAEELAADALFRLHRHSPNMAGGENLPGWLYRTAMNLGFDALRANSRRLRREDTAGREARLSEGQKSPLTELLAREKQERVRKVIATLKPPQGQVLLMCASGFSCKEMADVLGVKSGSLYVLIGRAKARFEKKYLEMYGRTE